MARHTNPLQWSDWDWLIVVAGLVSLAGGILWGVIELTTN